MMQINTFSPYFHSENKTFPIQAERELPVLKGDTVTLSAEAKAEFEQLALYPGWAAGYLPKVNVLNNADAGNVGYAAREANFRGRYQQELTEYTERFNQLYTSVKEQHGIISQKDHYEKVISGSMGSIAFRQSFEAALKQDARMMQLMGILGINQPS